jgi:uncharacterized protein YdaU (DUF1376 family)
MYFYPHHIGDFNNATRHLSRIERSIYRDLLDYYYDSESALPDDFELICRRVLAISEQERTAVQQVLKEFFFYDSGYTHERCEFEIKKYKKIISDKKKAGRASAKSRKANKDAAHKEVTGVEQVLNRCSTDVQQTKNQEPRTINQEPSIKIPYQLFADAYNDNFAIPCGLSRVAGLNESRKLAIKKLWLKRTNSEDPKENTNQTDYWNDYFAYCSRVPFLNGSIKQEEGKHQNWKANFDFLTKEKTYLKVLEGGYE